MPRNAKSCEHKYLTIEGRISTGGYKTKGLFPLLFFLFVLNTEAARFIFQYF